MATKIVRRLYSLYPDDVTMLERLANKHTNGNQSRFLRELVHDAYDRFLSDAVDQKTNEAGEVL